MAATVPATAPRTRAPSFGRAVATRGAAAALVVCLASAALLLARGRPGWRAAGRRGVGPGGGTASGAGADRFDTLSRGTVVATYAAILLQERFVQEGGRASGLGERALDQMRVAADTSASTAVIVLSVEGDDEIDCERLTAALLDAGERYIDSLGQPYVVRTVKSAAGSARRTRDLGGVALVLLAVAAAAGYVLVRSLRSRRGAP